MTHDIQDLLNLIKDLEERLIALELLLVHCQGTKVVSLADDHWYWDH